MRRKKDKSNGITALYERLSRDDDNAGESNSIVHQKQRLNFIISVYTRALTRCVSQTRLATETLHWLAV